MFSVELTPRVLAYALWGLFLIFGDRLFLDVVTTVGVLMVFTGAAQECRSSARTTDPVPAHRVRLIQIGLVLQLALTGLRVYLLMASHQEDPVPRFVLNFTPQQLETAAYWVLLVGQLAATTVLAHRVLGGPFWRPLAPPKTSKPLRRIKRGMFVVTFGIIGALLLMLYLTLSKDAGSFAL